MAYDFTVVDDILIATSEENTYEYSQPNLVLGRDRIYVKEAGSFVQDLVFEQIGDINEVTPENLIDAHVKLDALIKSIFLIGDGSPTNIGYTDATGALTSSTGTGDIIPLATDAVRGLMGETDFNKLNAIPAYADNASAVIGGLAVGDFYHTSGALKVVTV